MFGTVNIKANFFTGNKMPFKMNDLFQSGCAESVSMTTAFQVNYKVSLIDPK
jgi:hypothetical protein